MTFLQKSERLWKARHTYRSAKLRYWIRRGDEDQVDKWAGLRDEASRWLKKRRGQLAKSRNSLTTNFDVSEFDCRNGARVPEEAIPALRRLCEDVLEPLRKKYGHCTVTSGYRTRAYNASIPGSASGSQHIYDDTPNSVAADVRFAHGTPAQWASTARTFQAGGVGQYNRAGFVHVDNGPRRSWWG